MRDLAKTKLKYLSFYYFSLIFLVACIGFDFYVNTVTGFTFGYMAAFIYMLFRMRVAEAQLESYHHEE
jgi:protein-S-isoprenylcysteine O-methyltransferase Ste14